MRRYLCAHDLARELEVPLEIQELQRTVRRLSLVISNDSMSKTGSDHGVNLRVTTPDGLHRTPSAISEMGSEDDDRSSRSRSRFSDISIA